MLMMRSRHDFQNTHKTTGHAGAGASSKLLRRWARPRCHHTVPGRVRGRLSSVPLTMRVGNVATARSAAR